MDQVLIAIICIFALLGIIAFVIIRRKKTIIMDEGGENALSAKRKNTLASLKKHELAITFDDLSALTEQEETQLVEVKRQLVISKNR